MSRYSRHTLIGFIACAVLFVASGLYFHIEDVELEAAYLATTTTADQYEQVTPSPTPTVTRNVATAAIRRPAPEYYDNAIATDAAIDDDVELIARVLAGECYDDETEDKLQVAWVIISRVDAPEYPDTIAEVVSDTNYGVQFQGYYKQHRAVTDSDREVAREVIAAWLDGDYSTRKTAADGRAFLAFSSGQKGDKVNEFR